MHQTLRSSEIEEVIEHEICVVGAGAAGISLALELEKLGRSVLLLESGSFNYDQKTQALNKGYSVGQKYFSLQSSRLRFFGGTTGHWTGQCSTLDEIDFEERDWVKNSGWPIKKTDLDLYYEKAHKLLELQDYEYDPLYWQDKLEKQVLPFDNKLARTKVFQKSAPTRFGTKYREAIVQSKNVRLITEANLTNINLNEYGNVVEDLQIKTIEGKEHRVKSKSYVLACGAIQNVRYLLSSNNVVNKGVGNENDLVGRFFMEHPHVDSSNIVLLSGVQLNIYLDHTLNSKAFGMFGTSESIQRKLKLQNYSANVKLSGNLGPSIDNSVGAKKSIDKWENLDNRSQRFRKLKNVFGEKQIDRLIEKMYLDRGRKNFNEEGKYETTTYVLNTRCEQAPNPDSRIDLANTKDVLDIPHVRLNWQLSEGDKLSILKSNVILGRELGRMGVGRLKIKDWLLGDEINWPEFLAGGWHHMGVTRMSNDSKKGVVDKNCKVHSCENLYISGSSVFSTSGVANPTLTIVALSLRLAQHLNKQLSKNKNS